MCVYARDITHNAHSSRTQRFVNGWQGAFLYGSYFSDDFKYELSERIYFASDETSSGWNIRQRYGRKEASKQAEVSALPSSLSRGNLITELTSNNLIRGQLLMLWLNYVRAICRI